MSVPVKAKFIVTVIVFLIFISCHDFTNILDPEAENYQGWPLLELGDVYGGGVVFYLDDSGGGLIASMSDQSSGIEWYNGSYVTTGATALGIGAGSTNTASIVASQGDGDYAAKLCSDLELNDYNDWYLPSKDELNLMFEQKDLIGDLAGIYWSSSEFGSNVAWGQSFLNGDPGSIGKEDKARVRAVRAFP